MDILLSVITKHTGDKAHYQLIIAATAEECVSMYMWLHVCVFAWERCFQFKWVLIRRRRKKKNNDNNTDLQIH